MFHFKGSIDTEIESEKNRDAFWLRRIEIWNLDEMLWQPMTSTNWLTARPTHPFSHWFAGIQILRDKVSQLPLFKK